MKRYVLITGLILGLIISLSPGAFPQDAKADAKLAKAEAKLEKVLGTNSNWKATVFKDLRYGMPCKEVKKYFKGLKCSSFKQWDFPKVSGKLFGSVKEYRFTFKNGRLENATIVFGARITGAQRFATALLNVAQRKWGTLSPEKLSKKNKYWYNADRDLVSLSQISSNWHLKISMPKRDTGDVAAGSMSDADIKVSLATLLGTAKYWVVPSMNKFKRGLSCQQVQQVYKTMKGCNPAKSWSRGEVTIEKHPLVHALKFSFKQGQLHSAALIFHRQLDKERFKAISLELFEGKWGKVKPERRNKDNLAIYKSRFGIAQRNYIIDHWEIKHDFPKGRGT